MNHFRAAFGIVIGCLGILIVSCKDDSQTNSTPPPAGQVLSAVPAGVTVGAGSSQNVTVTGGHQPYTAQSQNPALATTQFVSNTDTAVITISGVSTATGTTSVIVRDASTPQRSTTVVVTKVP